MPYQVDDEIILTYIMPISKISISLIASQ